jgi:hypothetical protein
VVLDLEGGLLGGEAVVAVPPSPSQSLVVHLTPARRQQAVLKIQAHVGARGSTDQLIVFDIECSVPKFVAYVLVSFSCEP